jgi:hypothetical protein
MLPEAAPPPAAPKRPWLAGVLLSGAVVLMVVSVCQDRWSPTEPVLPGGSASETFGQPPVESSEPPAARPPSRRHVVADLEGGPPAAVPSWMGMRPAEASDAGTLATPPANSGSADSGLSALGMLRIWVADAQTKVPRADTALTVRSTGSRPLLLQTRTTSAGFAELALAYGSYTLEVDDESLGGESLKVNVNAPLVEQTLALRGPGTLEVTATNAMAPSAPLAGVVFSVARPREGAMRAPAGDGGSAALMLPGGVYAVEVSAPGFATERREALQLQPGRLRQERFSLVPLSATLAVVLRCGDHPCAGGLLEVTWHSGIRTARAGKDGVLRLAQLPATEVDVKASWKEADGAVRLATKTLVLQPNKRQPLTLELMPPEVPVQASLEEQGH